MRGHRTPGARPRVPDLAIGAVFLAVCAAIVAYAFAGLAPWKHPYQIHALVPDANQLRPGNPVRIAGVDAGTVTGIGRGPHGATRIDLEVGDSARPIHEDAAVRIRPRTFLEGGFYVDLSPGTPASPELPADGTIPLDHTTGPVQFSQFLTTFTAPNRQGLRRVFAELDRALGHGGAQALRELAPQLTPALRGGALVAEAMQGTAPHDLALLIRSSARVSAALASRDQELASMVANLRTTTEALTAREGALGAGVHQLDALLRREAPPALTALDRTLPSLRRLSVALDPAIRRAPPLVDQLTSAVTEFGSLVAQHERGRVLGALHATLVDLPTLLGRLAGAFPPIKPSTDCLTRRIVPLLTAIVPDGSLSTGQPVWKDLIHALVGLSSNAQNFDGNGFWRRYLAGGGPNVVSLPALGGLSGTTPGSSPILGSRPVWLGPGSLPPLRPHAPCSAQPLVRLGAATGAAPRSTPAARQARRFTRAQLERMLRQALRAQRGSR